MEMIKEQYERAIDAYRFHVKRYNTWTNYFTIFVGTLFVAYYSIDGNLLKLLISVVGYISTLCWLGSFKGYYTWLISWTNVLIYHENRYIECNKEEKEKLRLYSMVDKKVLKQYGFSTQKITRILIYTIIVVWLFIVGYTVYSVLNECCIYAVYFGIIAGLGLSILSVIIIRVLRKGLLSTVSSHYDLIKKGNEYDIEKP
jgi:hypothetical protein